MCTPGSLFEGSSFTWKYEEQGVIVTTEKNVVSVLMDFIMTSKSYICIMINFINKVPLK